MPTIKAPSSAPGKAQKQDASFKGPYSTADFRAAYSAGTATPSSVAESILDAIDGEERHRVAFLLVNKEACLTAAAKSTVRYQSGKQLGPLDGIPVAVKDEVDIVGTPRCDGSKLPVVAKAASTSWCVRQWEDAGAIIIGKLNMHEFGMDTTNCNPTKRTPLNPHNPNYFTGGSSGGSAYVVSAGLVPFALGADGGGSIRIPSAYCGIYGLKPSHNRVSAFPTPSLAPSVGVVGPMAGTLDDLALAFRTMAASDPNSPSSGLYARSAKSDRTVKKKILGLISSQWASSSAEVKAHSKSIVERCTDGLGYAVEEDLQIPYVQEGQLAHTVTILSEMNANLSTLGPATLAALQPANKLLLAIARQTPAVDLVLAQKLRALLMQHMSFLFTKHSDLIIVSPTTPDAGRRIYPGDLAHGMSDGDGTMRSMENIYLANLLGLPAITVPIGKLEGEGGGGKVPVGLQGMAAWGNESLLLEWAADLESLRGQGAAVGAMRPDVWVDVLELAKRSPAQ